MRTVRAATPCSMAGRPLISSSRPMATPWPPSRRLPQAIRRLTSARECHASRAVHVAVGGTGIPPTYSLLQQHAVPRVGGDEDLVALGQRLRGGRADDERPAVPVDVVLREVALGHALAD